jgi:hypothetical protein
MQQQGRGWGLVTVDGVKKAVGCMCSCRHPCGSRDCASLANQEFARCKPMREQGRGWGLITVDGVKKGSLVREKSKKTMKVRVFCHGHPNLYIV